MWLWTGPAGTGRAGMAGRSANGDGWVTLGLAGRGWGEREKGKDAPVFTWGLNPVVPGSGEAQP